MHNCVPIAYSFFKTLTFDNNTYLNHYMKNSNYYRQKNLMLKKWILVMYSNTTVGNGFIISQSLHVIIQ